jgi:NADP-dependent 3-hydroxy acid dehydrogenase YdfG
VFFITGGTNGIGAATARRALAAGHSVFVTGRSDEHLERVMADADADERLAGRIADASDWAQSQAAVADAVDRFGRLDVAFANAGVGAGGDLADGEPDAWRAMVLTNVYGVALTIKACLPHLVASRGHFVLTGSVVGRVQLAGSLYGATKAAVAALGESLRQQVKDTGVGVTVLEPGIVATDWYPTPMPWSLSAEDIAATVLWAVEQPPGVHINNVLVRPEGQPL